MRSLVDATSIFEITFRLSSLAIFTAFYARFISFILPQIVEAIANKPIILPRKFLSIFSIPQLAWMTRGASNAPIYWHPLIFLISFTFELASPLTAIYVLVMSYWPIKGFISFLSRQEVPDVESPLIASLMVIFMSFAILGLAGSFAQKTSRDIVNVFLINEEASREAAVFLSTANGVIFVGESVDNSIGPGPQLKSTFFAPYSSIEKIEENSQRAIQSEGLTSIIKRIWGGILSLAM